jgi:hydroxymethylbilane synthase
MNNSHQPALLLGTRRSALAQTQAQWVADTITATTGHRVRLVTMSSAGDESSAPIASFGSTGVFVTALREALLRREVDFVVHSFKDLPTAPSPDLHIPAIPVREDPRDALVWPGRPTPIAELPAGTRIGTGSPRRAAQLLAQNPHIRVLPLRGNVDSRMAKLHSGELDGIVLALAGLNRLGLTDETVVPLPCSELVPAPAQGALAVECRAEDDHTTSVLAQVDHLPTRNAVSAERAVLRALDAGCTAPVGAYSEFFANQGGTPRLRVVGLVATPDGEIVLRRRATGAPAEAENLGVDVAKALLAAGAKSLLDDSAAVDPRTPPPLTTR